MFVITTLHTQFHKAMYSMYVTLYTAVTNVSLLPTVYMLGHSATCVWIRTDTVHSGEGEN